MMKPEAALETLDAAARMLDSYAGQNEDVDMTDVYVVAESIGFMRDELYQAIVQHDPALNESLWAWVRSV